MLPWICGLGHGHKIHSESRGRDRGERPERDVVAETDHDPETPGGATFCPLNLNRDVWLPGPILRGFASRAPYFHNGSAATMSDAVEFYDRRFSIGFTAQQKTDLVNFLNAL